METSKNLYQRINQVMLEVEGVEKGITIEFATGKTYSAVSHDDVTKLLHKPIANAGIVLQTSVVESKMDIGEKEKEYKGIKQVSKEYMASVTVEITAINMDKPEERLSVRMPAIAFDNSDKAFGKAISMATKTGLLKLFMLESFDDEEKRDKDSKKPLIENKNSNSKVSAPQKQIEGIGNYVAKVGKFKGKKLGEIDAKELTDYCKYMKTNNPEMDGPVKEFIDKAREYVAGAN